MAPNAVVTVEEDEKEIDHKGFQSSAAKKAATKKPEPITAEDPKSAEVSGDEPAQVVVVDLTEQERLVKVRPRQDVLNMRVGPKVYSLHANKDALVPAHVRRHLEERNLV